MIMNIFLNAHLKNNIFVPIDHVCVCYLYTANTM